MASQEERRKAKQAYKEKETIGGLYRIIHAEGGWQGPAVATTNLHGHRGRLSFGIRTGTCPFDWMRDAWAQNQSEGFQLLVLEELERKPDQTNKDYAEELDALLALYAEGEAGQ